MEACTVNAAPERLAAALGAALVDEDGPKRVDHDQRGGADPPTNGI